MTTNHTSASDSPQTPRDDHDASLEGDAGFWERWGELLMAAGVIVLGVIVLVETQDIRTRPGVTVSPRIIPNIIGSALIVLGIWYIADIIRSPHQPGGGEDSEDVDLRVDTNWVSIAIIAVGLLCYTVLIEFAGFILASAALFFISAFAMGSRRYVRDAAIALLLGTGIFVMFDTWLGVRLPAGWIAGLL